MTGGGGKRRYSWQAGTAAKPLRARSAAAPSMAALAGAAGVASSLLGARAASSGGGVVRHRRLAHARRRSPVRQS